MTKEVDILATMEEAGKARRMKIAEKERKKFVAQLTATLLAGLLGNGRISADDISHHLMHDAVGGSSTWIHDAMVAARMLAPELEDFLP